MNPSVEAGPRPRIAFSWKGMPQYGARLLRAALSGLGEPAVVLGSHPDVPICGMEEALGGNILWIDDTKAMSWSNLGLAPPRIFFQSGWGYAAFNALGREVKRDGGSVVCFCDANWRGDFRQLVLGPIGFRTLHKPMIDHVIVSGQQGRRLMRHFGMPAERISTGYYGADPALFHGGPPLSDRPKTFLYVGQFIARKDVLTLADAFAEFVADHPGWTLRMIGSGVLREAIPQHPQIIVENFLQPAELAGAYRAARFFVLPSLVEAWGLVVHEAALSGCALVLSDAIGSGDDLASPENSVRFRAGRRANLLAALERAAAMTGPELVRAERKSREMAAQFGPERFAEACLEAVAKCCAVLSRKQ